MLSKIEKYPYITVYPENNTDQFLITRHNTDIIYSVILNQTQSPITQQRAKEKLFTCPEKEQIKFI